MFYEINNNDFLIKFGDNAESPFSINEYRNKENKIILQEKIKSKVPLDNCYFLRQIHNSNGLGINNNNFPPTLEHEGDFLITNIRKLPIGVLTADCLPIIFYDENNKAAAIAHAGWRGTIQNIAKNVVEHMKSSFKTDSSQVKIFFGPCAKSCCYNVDSKFHEQISNSNLKFETIYKRGESFFFDLPKYNSLLLKDLGIKHINYLYNICTICNLNFCSYRRGKEKSGLQMSIIMLK